MEFEQTSRSPKLSYSERFAKAITRLPGCIVDFEPEIHQCIPDLVSLVRWHISAKEFLIPASSISTDEDMLACNRFINVYEESD